MGKNTNKHKNMKMQARWFWLHKKMLGSNIKSKWWARLRCRDTGHVLTVSINDVELTVHNLIFELLESVKWRNSNCHPGCTCR